MNDAKMLQFCSEIWDRQIVPQLCDYIRIPNKSPMFDAGWVEHGYMREAMDLIETWVRAQPITGMKVERFKLPGRTPLLFIDIPGKGDDVVLLYSILAPCRAVRAQATLRRNEVPDAALHACAIASVWAERGWTREDLYAERLK